LLADDFLESMSGTLVPATTTWWKQGMKMKVSTIYLQKEYAYNLQETLCKATIIHGDLAYYMIMNIDTQDYSISSLLLHNLTDSKSADFVENEKPKSSHLREYCDVI
jgi:hypothetical protein